MSDEEISPHPDDRRTTMTTQIGLRTTAQPGLMPKATRSATRSASETRKSTSTEYAEASGTRMRGKYTLETSDALLTSEVEDRVTMPLNMFQARSPAKLKMK